MSSFLAGEPGLAFGIATGRSLQEADRLLREWELPLPEAEARRLGELLERVEKAPEIVR